jgi:hypothetical protein
MSEDAEDSAAKTDNQALLFDYISKCLDDEDSIELYSCWSGDEELPVEHERTIDVAELVKGDFWFAERQRTVVTSDRILT